MFTRFSTITLILISCLFLIAGCSSDSPTPVTPEPEPIVDTAPPSVPTSLNASGFNSWVKLIWDDNTVDGDLMGFNVYRQTSFGNYLLTEAPLADPQFIDYFPLERGSVYAVTAIDENGNESAWISFNYVPTRIKGPELKD